MVWSFTVLLLLGCGAISLAWFAIQRGRDVSIKIGGPKVGIHLETRPSASPPSVTQVSAIPREDPPRLPALETPARPTERLIGGS